jgi:DNA-binding MurR/RpiR family transcriptional regulator
MIVHMANSGSTPVNRVHRYQSLIQSRLNQLSTGEQAVAAHLAAHPAELPFETAESLAKRLGISAMTVGRTLKALGYRGLGELRAEMRSEVPEAAAAPWLSRGTTQPVVKNVDRARALRAEIEAIEAVHALAETTVWRNVVSTLAGADRVFVTGFQTERGVAMSFADQLAYVRPEVRLLSVADRAFADLRTEASEKSCLVLIDCRRYSRWFRLLAQRATELRVPAIIVTDAYCRWATELSQLALRVRTDSGRFWDNNAPLASLLNLLLEDVIERLGDTVYTQLDAASEFGAAFVGFDRVHRKRDEGGARARRQRNGKRSGR